MVRTGASLKMERREGEWPEDQQVPSVWYTSRERARDDLFLKMRDMRRSRTDVPPTMEADLERLNAEIESARAHDLKIEKKHAAECNRVKAAARRSAGVRSVDDTDEDENW